MNALVNGKILWYVARADLAKPGVAGLLHSREDVRGLRKLGWDAVLLAAHSDGFKTPDGVKEISVQDMTKPFERVWFELNVIQQLVRSDRKPDFVLFRGPTNLILCGMACWLLKIPFGVELNGISTYHIKHGYWFRRHVDRLFESFFMRRSDVLIGVTEELSAWGQANCKSSAIVATARNGINAELIKPCTDQSRDSVLKIGFLGEAHPARGLGECIEVISVLRGIGIDARFVSVGGGPEVPTLREQAKSLGLEPWVEFKQYVPPELMATAVADCCMMWASFEDDYRLRRTGLSPLKIWTYLSIAKPVIIRYLDVLTYYQAIPGLLWVKSKTSAGLADEILSYWRTLGLKGLKQEGTRGREYIIENISWDHHARIISDAILRSFSTSENKQIA